MIFNEKLSHLKCREVPIPQTHPSGLGSPATRHAPLAGPSGKRINSSFRETLVSPHKIRAIGAFPCSSKYLRMNLIIIQWVSVKNSMPSSFANKTASSSFQSPGSIKNLSLSISIFLPSNSMCGIFNKSLENQTIIEKNFSRKITILYIIIIFDYCRFARIRKNKIKFSNN